jgi:putative peptide zinc metalloprotease protein
MNERAAPLFSASWYRVAGLKPRLRNQARIVRHSYRGERWYVLQDLASGRFLRLNADAYRLVALMDGVRTLNDIWQNACATLGDEAPTQDELMQLLAQLHQANVLLTGQQPDAEEMDERRKKLSWVKLKQYMANPLSLKLPLFDPDRLLTAIAARLPRGAGFWMLAIWLLTVMTGVAAAGVHWEELTRDLTSLVFTAENMLLLALAFPVLKAIHEFGHGLALKMAGGSCHEMGLMFLVLMPVPYMDATQAAALQDKRQRMLVGLAGMMIELFVAAIALWLWTWAAPGVGKALLHQVVVLASVTTLLFNANPLLRFDGYYVLADWLEIPNLGQKANQYVGYLVQRHVFKAGQAVAPPLTPREPAWLLSYAVLSFIYRLFVAFAIILFVTSGFFFVGILLGLWVAYSMLLLPLGKQLKFLAQSPVLQGRRARAWALSGGTAGALALLLLLAPAPSWTFTEGVIWMPEQSQLRAPHPCFAEAVLAESGAGVVAGQPLVSCRDHALEAERVQTAARVQEQEARLALAGTLERTQYQLVENDLRHDRQRLADLEQRLAALIMRSPHAGQFVMAAAGNLPGRYLERGDVIGYVLDPARFTLLTVVPQGEVDLVRRHTERVELRSPDRIWELLPARITREVPAASTELPSLALSMQGGGPIGLDPSAEQGESPKSLVSLFQFEINFSTAAVPRTLGNRVYVRFVHTPEPLALQWWRSLRQLFLKRFTW